MANRYHFQWDPVEGAEAYALIEDGGEIVPEIKVPEIDVLFTDVAAGTHIYQVRAYNATSEILSPELELIHDPLSGTVENFRYSIV